LRAHDPSHAQLFYHPACLVDYFLSVRFAPRRTHLLAAVERRVLNDIQSVGVYPNKPHIVNALRCLTADASSIGGLRVEGVFPTLWSRRFLRFCAEAFPKLDENTSVYMPYCPLTPASSVASQPQRARRRINALFFGSVPSRRVAGTRARRLDSVSALRRLPGAKVVLLSERDGSSNVSARAMALMRESEYTLCPYGDTPESRRIYQALSVGSIPIVEDDFQRVGIAPWSHFSIRISRACRGRCGCPNATFQSKRSSTASGRGWASSAGVSQGCDRLRFDRRKR
jgi:hypothetical protein